MLFPFPKDYFVFGFDKALTSGRDEKIDYIREQPVEKYTDRYKWQAVLVWKLQSVCSVLFALSYTYVRLLSL